MLGPDACSNSTGVQGAGGEKMPCSYGTITPPNWGAVGPLALQPILHRAGSLLMTNLGRAADGQPALLNQRGERNMSDRLPSFIDRHIAARLHARRLEVGVTQEQAARAIGVTFQQYQKYEHATNRISAGKLYLLAQMLDVRVQYFFEGLGRRSNKRRKV